MGAQVRATAAGEVDERAAAADARLSELLQELGDSSKPSSDPNANASVVGKLALEIDSLQAQLEHHQASSADLAEAQLELGNLRTENKSLQSKVKQLEMNSSVGSKEEMDEIFRLYTREKEKVSGLEKELRRARDAEQEALARANEWKDQVRRAEENAKIMQERAEAAEAAAVTNFPPLTASQSNISHTGSAGALTRGNSNMASDMPGGGSPVANNNAGGSRSLVRIQAERTRAQADVERLNREEATLQAVADQELVLGDSRWLRNMPSATGGTPGTTRPAAAAGGCRDSTVKVTNLLAEEEDRETLQHTSGGTRRGTVSGGQQAGVGSSASSVSSTAPSPVRSMRTAARATVQPDGRTPAAALAALASGPGLGASGSGVDETSDETRKSAFRAVGRDDVVALSEALTGVDPGNWLQWINGAGDGLLKMADARKREKTLHFLRKRMGVSDLISAERRLVSGDNVWVFRQLGDLQPEQATVRALTEDEKDSKDDLVTVEFWASKAGTEVVPAVRCRLMLQAAWQPDVDEE